MSYNYTDTSRPDWTRPEVRVFADDLQLVHDLLGGTSQMHRRATAYIRKWKHEQKDVYNIRSKIEEVEEGLNLTLSAGVGMIYAKPPQVEWNGGAGIIEQHWENIDGGGASGHVFSKRFSDAALRDGVNVLLIDFPARPRDPQTGEEVRVTAANESELGLTPRWAAYGRADVLNWRTGVVGNRKTLTMLALRENGEVEDGRYGMKPVERVRVLEVVRGVATWRLLEKRRQGGEVVFAPLGAGTFRNNRGQVATRLPVAECYTGRTDATLVASIPLLGVAWANLGHWRQSTNLRFYRELCAFPQPKLKGRIPDEGVGEKKIPGQLRIGPLALVRLEQDGDFSWEELTGSSMDQLERGVQEKVSQMAKQGLSFLSPETRAAETAEAKRLDATAQNANLATAAQGIEDALNVAFEWHAWYLGIAEAPVISLSRDFESTAMTPDEMRGIAALVKEGMPVSLALQMMKAGGRIGADADLRLLELQWLASSGAQDTLRDAERTATLDEMGADAA